MVLPLQRFANCRFGGSGELLRLSEGGPEDAPGSSRGTPRAILGRPGALRGPFLGVLEASRTLFRRSAEAFSARAGFPGSVEACSGLPIVLKVGSGVADMIPPGSTIRLEISE